MDQNKRIGDYEILGELGRGGMGRVYRVRNVISERVEAMKVLLPDLIGHQDFVARFLREIKVLAALNHPNIASLRTALTVDNQLIMIMEYVEGQSLAKRLEQGPVATSDALAYVDQVLNALQYAHDHHVVHRDIKPANMMLTPQGVVKLMDFGIARSEAEPALTIAGTTTGSLSYMPPEQIRGEGVDVRSDLYSLGVSLYEMVTGQRPFVADTDYAIMEAHLKMAPRPPLALQPGLAPELNDLILKAIAKDPEQRFQSADAFRAAIDKFRSIPVPATASSPSATMVETVLAIPSTQAVTVGPVAQPPLPMAASRPSSEQARTSPNTRAASTPAVNSPAASVPPGTAVPPPAARSGHPGLYMLAGAILVIVAMVGTGVYLRRAEAEPGTVTGSVESQQTPSMSTFTKDLLQAPAPPAVPPPGTAEAPTTKSESTAGEATHYTDTSLAPKVAGSQASSQASGQAVRREPATGAAVAATAAAAKPGAPAQAAANSNSGSTSISAPVAEAERAAQEPPRAVPEPPKPAVDFDELEHEIDQLSARASAVHNSLDRLQQQQARQGLGLRGDIAARQEGLTLNLSKAQEAINQRNATRAQRYKALAEADVDALERFLGR